MNNYLLFMCFLLFEVSGGFRKGGYTDEGGADRRIGYRRPQVGYGSISIGDGGGSVGYGSGYDPVTTGYKGEYGLRSALLSNRLFGGSSSGIDDLIGSFGAIAKSTNGDRGGARGRSDEYRGYIGKVIYGYGNRYSSGSGILDGSGRICSCYGVALDGNTHIEGNSGSGGGIGGMGR